MRNLIIGIIFGCVLGAVIGATVLGPQLIEKVPGFMERSLANNHLIQPFGKNYSALSYGAKSSQLKNSPTKLPNKNIPITQWKMTSTYNLATPKFGDLIKRIEDQIWRVSNGRFKIQFDDSGTPITSNQTFDAVSSGEIDAAFSSPSEWGEKVSALSLFSAVPFGPAAREYMAWFYFSDGQKIFNDIYHKKGIHSIICGMSAPEASG